MCPAALSTFAAKGTMDFDQASKNRKLWHTPRSQPKSASSRFPPAHWAHIEGQLGVGLTRSPSRRRMAAICALRTTGVDVTRRSSLFEGRAVLLARYLRLNSVCAGRALRWCLQGCHLQYLAPGVLLNSGSGIVGISDRRCPAHGRLRHSSVPILKRLISG